LIYLQERPSLFRELDGWIRHRLRMLHLKQWKNGPNAYRQRRARGLSHEDAAKIAGNLRRWWRNLKHSWLFINSLDSRAAVQRPVTFYVKEHNEGMPHGALDWRTPNEVYFRRAEDVPIKLDVARRAKRA
jgi:hypothetical protein